jgi:hypothetical protein
VEPAVKQYTKQVLLESQPNLEPLPDIAPEWDGLDEDANVSASAAPRVVEDAVVPVKREPGLKREGSRDSMGMEGRVASLKRKLTDDEGDKQHMLATYHVPF